jgi:hypothetical protein
MMVKQIWLNGKAKANEGFLGTFVDDTCYDVLLTEDTDVYKSDAFGKDTSDQNVLLKFRKGVFSPEVQKAAYLGLKDGATTSHNRGIATGPIVGDTQKQSPDSAKGREWVTDLQFEVLNFFMQPAVLTLDEEKLSLDRIFKQFEGKEKEVSSLRGHVWLTEKIEAASFKFFDWARETERLSKQDQIEEARIVSEEYISSTNYANPVFSGVGGFYDRYPRIPFCRATSYTANNREKFDMALPFIEDISNWFAKLLPTRWAVQQAEIMKIDPDYHIGKSVYTTITINKNFRTACHRDAGDLEAGFGNLTALSDERQWAGGYLCFPEYRVAVDIRPGDVLLMDVHEIHGNTPISPLNGKKAERISIVCYFREKMNGCSAKKYEDYREKFVFHNKSDKTCPGWKENFNGVYAGMWESERWYDYLRANLGEDSLRQYHPEAMTSSLDEFFL